MFQNELRNEVTMFWIGIDPGIRGALAALGRDGIVDVIHMPLLDKKRVDVFAIHESG